MLDQPISHEDYEELAEAGDLATANDLLKGGWYLLGIVSGAPVTYVFGRPRMTDLREMMEATEAIMEQTEPASEVVPSLEASRPRD
jgi:hypothetical protein